MARPLPRPPAIGALVLAVALLATGCGSQTADPTAGKDSSGTGSADTTDTDTGDTDAGDTDAGTPASSGSTEVPATLDFTAETVAGDAFAGADLAGKPTVLWFWAPWCPTCHAQISGVGELAAKHGSEVNVVGVGALDEREAIEGFAEGVSPDVTLLADPDGEVWRHFEVTAQSTYVILDENGVRQGAGYLDDAELAAMVADLAG